jgi:hypothetical protein
MAIPVTDKQIRQAIAAAIEPLVGTGVVYSWNVLKAAKTGTPEQMRQAVSEWLPMFQTSDGLTHGWVIRRAERTSEHMGGTASYFYPVYDVWGFYGYYSTDEDTNSENDFNAVIDALADAFPAQRTLTVNSRVLQSGGLQFPVISLLFGTEEMVHFAGGRIELQFDDC